MNILIVSAHPAQVHGFKYVREELLKAGHTVYWGTTPKDIAVDLLNTYGIKHFVLEKAPKTFFGRVHAMLRNLWSLIPFLHRHKIDLIVDRYEPFTTVAAWLTRTPHICLADTEHAARICKPLMQMCDSVLVPDCFYEPVVKKQMYFPGNIEMFYCRLGRFVLNEPWSLLGFEPGTRYAIVRFVKWDAYHDTKLIGGYTPEDKIHLVHSLIEAGLRVLITSEAELPAELEQYRTRVPIERMHDVMACAELFIGESSSMASECVVLGTPAIYVDEVGRGYTDEEAREGLLYMYRPYADKTTWQEAKPDDKDFILGGRKESIEKAIEIASPSFNREEWRKRHQAWMATKFDCTAWLAWFIENYPESEKMWRENRQEMEERFK